MKRKIFVFASLLFCFNSFSQSLKYIDENMKTIDSITYFKKCNSIILKCLNFKTDSLNFNKVIYRFKFGDIDSLGYSQIRKLLIKSSTREIDENDFLMIRYNDTIYDSKASRKSFERHVKNHKSGNHRNFNLKKYKSGAQNWIKSQKKCQKKFNKLNAEIFYVYNHDYGYTKEFTDIKWIKDRGLFKNAFFKIIYSGNFLLVKPDGEYFISGGHLSNKLLKKLIKNKDWSKFKLDWKSSYYSLSEIGFGVFKKSKYHTKHCF